MDLIILHMNIIWTGFNFIKVHTFVSFFRSLFRVGLLPPSTTPTRSRRRRRSSRPATPNGVAPLARSQIEPNLGFLNTLKARLFKIFTIIFVATVKPSYNERIYNIYSIINTPFIALNPTYPKLFVTYKNIIFSLLYNCYKNILWNCL